MSKKRKLHQLIGTIKNAYLGLSKSKTYKNQPFYSCDIVEETLLGPRKATIYVFYNLVNKEFWTILEQRTYKNQKCSFWCEKRTRGWRLRDGEEIK